MNFCEGLSVERLFVGPYCFSLQIMSEFKKSFIFLCVTFSDILENAVSNEFSL
jgi:hypothetical protein